MNGLNLLEQDHKNVTKLFSQIREEGSDQRKKLFDMINAELTLHTHIEETVFYPAMKEHAELKEMVEEAQDEHEAVKVLLKKMEGLDPESDEFNSGLTDLIQDVQHHIGEEEGEMFPQARELCDEAALEKLGKDLETAKGKQQRES
jgi:hemerythrin superfamily protein